jgi:hypothetical protein
VQIGLRTAMVRHMLRVLEPQRGFVENHSGLPDHCDGTRPL